MPRRPPALLVLASILAAATVGCRGNRAPRLRGDAGAPDLVGQRVFQPSPGLVRAVPPHSIQPTAVGPYQLGTELRDILAMLDPRVELFDIDNAAKYSLVRAEGDRVLVGVGSSGRVSFISVLEPEIAKTAGGFGVGASVDELIERLGPRVELASRTSDPRLLELERLPGAHILIEDGRAAAIVVGRGGPGAPPAPPPPDAVSGTDAPISSGKAVADTPGSGAVTDPPAGDPAAPSPDHSSEKASPCAHAAEVIVRAELPPAAPLESRGRASAGCFTGTSPELVVQSERGLVLYGGEPARLRKLSSIDLASLVFAGPLDIDGDLRHELVAVTEKRTGDSVTVRAHVLRVEGGRLTVVREENVYRVTAATTVGWFGAKLSNVDLVLWADARPGAIEVRGLYVDSVDGRKRHVVPLVPRTIPVPRKKPEGSGSAAPPGSTRPVPPTESGPGAGTSPGSDAESPSGAEPGSSSPAPDPKSANTDRSD
jgi:hypothetical protein